MENQVKQVKITKNGIEYSFTSIDNKFTKTYQNDEGYYILFNYKNESAWLKAIKKFETN